MAVLIEAMNLVRYIMDADFRDPEELYETDAEEVLTELADFLLCSPPYSVNRQSELENISHDMFGPSNMDSFYNRARRLIKPGGRGIFFCYALQLSH